MRLLRAVVLLLALGATGDAAGVITVASTARAQDGPRLRPGEWSVMLGAGVGAKPEYEGASDIEFSPVPLVDIRVRPDWMLLDTVFLSTHDGFGAFFFNSRAFKLGASVNYDSGRDEDDGGRLNGLGDIDAGPQLRVFAGTRLGPIDTLLSAHHTFGGVDGTTVTLTASRAWALAEDLRLRLRASGEWGDEKYMAGYFGVSAAQAARSGLSRHDADAGIKAIGLSLTAFYSFSPRWLLTGTLGVKHLLGDAADSPIVESEAQPFGLLGIAYRF